MKIAIGGDHAGFPMKGPVVELIERMGHEVTDFGTHSTEPVDFPDIAQTVCDEIRGGRAERSHETQHRCKIAAERSAADSTSAV